MRQTRVHMTDTCKDSVRGAMVPPVEVSYPWYIFTHTPRDTVGLLLLRETLWQTEISRGAGYPFLKKRESA
jgi:hypothetical protein